MSKKQLFNRADCIMGAYNQEQDRLKYEKAKQEQERTPQHLRSEQYRSLLKKMTYTNEKLASIRLSAFNEMSSELITFIKQDLINNAKLSKFEQAEEIMNFYKRNFINLEELSNGTAQNPVYIPPYDKFFLTLMKLNAYFIYFARPKTFEVSGVPFSKIPYRERMEVLKPHLESLKLFENEKFTNRYGKYFETITKETSI